MPLIDNGVSASVATTFALYEGSISVTAVLDKQTHVVTIRVVSQDDDGDVYSDHRSDVPAVDLAEEIVETFDSII